MAIKRDSLRAQRDFYSPMTGNTGTEIRYAAAPTQTQSKYGSQVKERLSEIGQAPRRSAPIIKAIKTAMKKTDDPFTQVGQQKSYAPQQEENQIGAQIEGIASAAQDAVSEGVAQAESAVEEYRKGSSQKAAERRAQRQQERQSDLKARKAAADERAALRGDMKKLFARDKRMYGNTVPKGSMGSGSKPGPAVDTRPRHAVGGPGDQPKVSKFEKPKGGQGGLRLGATTLRQGEKPTGPAVKVTNYKDIRKARLDRREKARQAKKEGTTKAVNASTFKQKNVRGSGIPGKSGKDESARPKQVANLPSNYKATEAKAFAEAKAFKERQAKAKKSLVLKKKKIEAMDPDAREEFIAKEKEEAAARTRKSRGQTVKFYKNPRNAKSILWGDLVTRTYKNLWDAPFKFSKDSLKLINSKPELNRGDMEKITLIDKNNKPFNWNTIESYVQEGNARNSKAQPMSWDEIIRSQTIKEFINKEGLAQEINKALIPGYDPKTHIKQSGLHIAHNTSFKDGPWETHIAPYKANIQEGAARKIFTNLWKGADTEFEASDKVEKAKE